MKAQKAAGTDFEMRVRRQLHALGYRYRVDRKLLADHTFRGDIVWTGRRLVVFLDGCFWHGCPAHYTAPKSNTAWWQNKIQTNRARDRRVTDILLQRGWTVLRFWEHDDNDDIVWSVRRYLEPPVALNKAHLSE